MMAVVCSKKKEEALFIAMDSSEAEDLIEGKSSIQRLELGSIARSPSIQDYMTKEMRKKRAAVLICIFSGSEGELRVILTRRSMKLSSHPGDVALPGGRTDECDVDDSATALREAMEEIGLDPNLVRVVANLEPFISSNLLTVVPVVGLLSRVEDFKPVINADEVDAMFDAPLEMFLEEDGRHKCLEKEWKGWKYACHVFELECEQGNFLVGGLTASILIHAASIIYQRSPSFHQNLQDFSQLQWTLSSPAPPTNHTKCHNTTICQ